tara:strand:+ start:181 stop:948 length:768 start_codon:yes stop_codon:yes gene_type:complete
MAEKKKYDFPTEIISLPSEGKCYPEKHPLAKGQVEIKYMTAKEEEILASQNLIKKGVVLDKLFESIIVDKGINPDDILLGDKNAIVLATRILGYGPEYKAEITNKYGDKEDVNIDLAKIQTKDVDLSKLSRENLYEWVTPIGKNIIKFKLLSHGDEKKIDIDVKAMDRLNKGGVSAELTTRYRYMIQSVDGKEDTKSINNFINNKFLSRDTRAFRNHIMELQPDMNMKFEHEDIETGEKEEMIIPLGIGFFYPTE